MPKSSIFDKYETYDTTNGFGNPNEWQSAFNQVVSNTSSIDPYTTLNIPSNATQEQIKSAYRSLAKKFHPDKCPNSNRFDNINKAYKLIYNSNHQDPILPQLLQEITESELEYYLTSPLYCAQEKHDGRRRILNYTANKLYHINRKGSPVESSLFLSDAQLSNLQEFTLDGEEVSNIFYNFDVLSINGEILKNQPYSERIKKLLNTPNIIPVYTAYTTQEKRDLFNKLKSSKEGIVFKLLSGIYTSGYSPEQVKFKFYSTASMIVLKHNIKDSIQIGVYKNNTIIPFGNVTMTGHSKPPINSIVEIKYLYAVNALYQPSYLGPRDDLYPQDCTIQKLKFKS
jgi:ATP-dependent DNA ligase